jgi:hypothetical protein
VLLGRDRATARHVVSFYWPKAPPLNIKLAQGAIVGRQPFANGATVAVDPTTNDLVVIEPLREPGGIRYRRVNAKGKILLERLLTLPVQPLTDAHYDKALSSWREGGGAEHRALPPQALRAAIYRPQSLPTVRGMVISNDGVIWLQSGAETASLTTWVLLAPSGRILNAVTGPPRLRLLSATNGKIIGALTDQSGIVALVQYHVEP